MLVMQEDPEGEHQENVLATGMVANSRPRDNMTRPRGRQTEAALLVSACIALCEFQPKKARPPATTRPIQLTHIGADQPPIMTGQSIYKSPPGGTAPPRRRLPQPRQKTVSGP